MADVYKFVRISNETFAIVTPNSVKIIGTKVVSGSGDYRVLIKKDEILSMLKQVNPNIDSFSAFQCEVSSNNGDAGAANVRFYEPEWWEAYNAYYQYFYPGITGAVRINYRIDYIFNHQ